MKIISTLAATAVSAIVLSATPSQAQFFDPLFQVPAAAVQAGTGIATGAVGAATGVVGATTGGFFGGGYPENYNGYTWNPMMGWTNAGYNNGWGAPGYGAGYAQTAPAYGTAPAATTRSAYRSYRQYRRSPDNQYN